MANWYPQNKQELEKVLSNYIKKGDLSKKDTPPINGIIVPHAGYQFSGKIAGKAFSLLKGNPPEKAIILGPSHYQAFSGARILQDVETPLGNSEIIENNFKKINKEHSVKNQIPFLQKINPDIKILPLVIGNLYEEDIKKISKNILEKIDEKTLLMVSTDLSHFLSYQEAIKKDKETISAIKKLDSETLKNMEGCACGIFPLLVLIKICKIKKWKPKLLEYKNSGDIIPETRLQGVVGYCSMYF